MPWIYLTICVEAGLGFEAAMAKVYEKWDNELASAFGRVIREIQLGKVRKEAMRDMAERLGITEMTSFVAAVIQSEQLGVSMAQVLRIQADQMRIRRRQIAEEKAHQAPIKMLIPMGIFIFPSICIVLMTPAVLILIKIECRSCVLWRRLISRLFHSCASSEIIPFNRELNGRTRPTGLSSIPIFLVWI